MRSMTGFGRGGAKSDGISWIVECNSVNRRALEVVVNLPRDLAELESAVRNKVGSVVSRGRINVSIQIDAGTGAASVLRVDENLAEQYLNALGRMAKKFGFDAEQPHLSDLPRFPGVFQIEQGEFAAGTAWPLIERSLDGALAALIEMRVAEGASLKTDIEARLQTIDGLLAAIGALAPAVPAQYRKNLRQRLEEAGLPLPLDDDRLVKEIALFADRCDISEEITRAGSHLKQFRSYLESSEPMGRSMDFLSQELFREFNTMGSKANQAEIAHLVVTAKTEIEKVREQVQNVE